MKILKMVLEEVNKKKTYAIISLVGLRKRIRSWADTTSNVLKKSAVSLSAVELEF